LEGNREGGKQSWTSQNLGGGGKEKGGGKGAHTGSSLAPSGVKKKNLPRKESLGIPHLGRKRTPIKVASGVYGGKKIRYSTGTQVKWITFLGHEKRRSLET